MFPSKRAWPIGSLVLTHFVSLCKKCLYGMHAYCSKLPIPFSTQCIIVKNNRSIHLTIIDTFCDILYALHMIHICYMTMIEKYVYVAYEESNGPDLSSR